MDNVQCTEHWIPREYILERYELYKTILFRIAFSYLGNKHDCEDILQEAFIKLCYHSPEFRSSDDEKNWIIRVTINLCKNHLNSSWFRKKINIDEIEEYAITTEDRDLLLAVIQLPQKYKVTIQLHYFIGYTVAEISGLLSISESAVKMRLKRAREILKIEMGD